jgi:16S rRNA (guanine1207-N2)-methyltransferase
MKNIEVDEGEKALDLACGYGAVGLYLRKKFSTDLTLSDDDLLAVRYAERNFRENDAEGEFVHCDCLESFSEESFDVIVSNPPTHQGRGITDEMFKESYTKLRPGGRLVIVYNMNMSFTDELEEIFDSTEVLEDRDNFRVLKASKSF